MSERLEETAKDIIDQLNRRRLDGEEKLDVGETAALTRSLIAWKAKVHDVIYPDLKIRNFVPVSHDADPGAETVMYRQYDMYGMAKVISNYADDLPRVDVLQKEFPIKVRSLGDSFGYSAQDLRRAALSGNMIDAKRAIAARRGMELAIDDFGAFGFEDAPGFLNNSNVPLVTPITGTWATATSAQIIADLNKLVNSIFTTTKTTWVPDTLILPTSAYAAISSTAYSTQTDKTVMRWFLDNNPHIKNIDYWYKLDTADAARTGARAVAYKRDPAVLELEIPMEFNQMPPEAQNLAWKVACEARIAGCMVYQPKAIAYMDGI